MYAPSALPRYQLPAFVPFSCVFCLPLDFYRSLRTIGKPSTVLGIYATFVASSNPSISFLCSTESCQSRSRSSVSIISLLIFRATWRKICSRDIDSPRMHKNPFLPVLQNSRLKFSKALVFEMIMFPQNTAVQRDTQKLFRRLTPCRLL